MVVEGWRRGVWRRTQDIAFKRRLEIQRASSMMVRQSSIERNGQESFKKEDSTLETLLIK